MKASRNVLVPILALALAAFAAAQTDVRATPVDFLILVDRSKSMDVALEDVKTFLARELVGPAMIVGDRVELLAFYGETESVWSGRIASEADKAALLRSLRSLAPDGRYTDIGAALDAADAILSGMGDAGTPKFVLLLTDERQEAPPGSPYASDDYVARHPRLEFARRIDLGSFRAITIGYGLDARLEAQAETLFELLAEPPSAVPGLLPGAPEGAQAIGDGGALSISPAEGGSSAGGSSGAEPRGADGPHDSGDAGDGDASSAGAASRISPLLPGAIALAVLSLAAAVFLIARRRQSRSRDDVGTEPTR